MRRTRSEILKAIFEALKEKPLILTRLMHKSETNLLTLNELLKKSISANFITKQNPRKGRIKYALTLDGLAALKKLKEAFRTIKSVMEAS